MSQFVEAATLARLIETGRIRESKRNLRFIMRYDTAQWLERSTRKAEWIVRTDCKADLEKRLTEIAPDWKEDFAFLRSLRLTPYNPDNIRSLPALKQKSIVSGIINRRNWNAASGVGPKHKAKLQSEAMLTTDWVMRFRPSRDLQCVTAGQKIDLYNESLVYTECCFPERMWHQFGTFTAGIPRALITCENLGAYIDLPITPDMMAVFCPGKDTVAVIKLLQKLPNTRWIHFGDLDPEGYKIAQTIANATNQDVDFYIPSFAADYLPGRRFNGSWNNYKGPKHVVIDELIKTRRRIFHEVFMLDPRLTEDLKAYIDT